MPNLDVLTASRSKTSPKLKSSLKSKTSPRMRGKRVIRSFSSRNCMSPMVGATHSTPMLDHNSLDRERHFQNGHRTQRSPQRDHREYRNFDRTNVIMQDHAAIMGNSNMGNSIMGNRRPQHSRPQHSKHSETEVNKLNMNQNELLDQIRLIVLPLQNQISSLVHVTQMLQTQMNQILQNQQEQMHQVQGSHTNGMNKGYTHQRMQSKNRLPCLVQAPSNTSGLPEIDELDTPETVSRQMSINSLLSDHTDLSVSAAYDNLLKKKVMFNENKFKPRLSERHITPLHRLESTDTLVRCDSAETLVRTYSNGTTGTVGTNPVLYNQKSTDSDSSTNTARLFPLQLNEQYSQMSQMTNSSLV